MDKSTWLRHTDRLGLELPPVAISFAIQEPEGLDQLKRRTGFCEMLGLAHRGRAFYAGPENHDCPGGLAVLGQPVPDVFESGRFGAGLGVFEHYRAMARVYDYLPRLNPERRISQVLFAPLAELTFEPDLLVFVAELDQAEILLRATSYSTGTEWTSRFAPVIGCAWLFVYPYLSGQMNYTLSGLGSGMARRKVVPPGKMIVAIPYDLFGTILHGLERMDWVLPSNQPDGDEFRIKLARDLGLA